MKKSTITPRRSKMPKDAQNVLKLDECLATLEDTTLYNNISRTKCFECLKAIFDEGGDVMPADVRRTLAVFVDCIIKNDINCAYAISAVSSLIRNVKTVESLSVQDLIPSALAVLHMIKRLCVPNNMDVLRKMSFDLFLLYPGDVFAALVKHNCHEILEIFDSFKLIKTNALKLDEEPCQYLYGLLKNLPPGERLQFTKEGIRIWFGDLLPTTISLLANDAIEQKYMYLECLEILTEDLILIDYSKHPLWQGNVLECICNPNKYPIIIKHQLQRGSNVWHRVWVIFIKLLKNQITCNFTGYGTPINALLPVVETAFKMHVLCRIQAFQCWDVLIDIFSKETDDSGLPKRIKLMVIPLKLNNAKTEDTALAKFNTWWCLIRKFHHRLDKYTNDILVTFLHFMFGKEASGTKLASVGVANQYDKLGSLCLEAFVNIVGHVNYCSCSPDLPKLSDKIMSNKLLITHWNDWLYALKMGIKLSASKYKMYYNGDTENQPMPVLCVWKSLAVVLAELPDNGVRRDLFSALIQVLIDFIEECNSFENLPDVLFSLTLALCEDDKIKNILTSKTDEPPMRKLVTIVLNPAMNDFYKRCPYENVIKMLKPLTNLIVEKEKTTPHLEWLLDKLYSGDEINSASINTENFSVLWTALVESVTESAVDVCSKLLTRLLLCPVKSVHQISKHKYAAMPWYTLYSLKGTTITIEKEVMDFLTVPKNNKNSIHFKLCMTNGLLKNKLVSGEDTTALTEVLENLTFQMSDYKEFEPMIPVITDTLVAVMHKLTKSHNRMLVAVALNCVLNVLRISILQIQSHKSKAGNSTGANIIIILNNLFEAVGLICKIPSYSDANCDFIEALKEHAATMDKESPLFICILSNMKSFLMNTSSATVKSIINSTIDLLQATGKINKTAGDANKAIKVFTIPDSKKLVKSAKKRETSIVNTVVENGEEYVVVKSNWKFNPRKLTENQKEKFQRKREDIPALYQDLSQSQDEFKLQTWKTDSQDTTSSNSKSEKSMTNDNAANILKSSLSSDVIPNIMENFLSGNDKIHAKPEVVNCKETVDIVKIDNNPSIVELLPVSSSKTTKSPRLALKDRVFRNVRNLIEKSTPKNVTEENPGVEFQTENLLKSPPANIKDNVNLINSAPPLISAERPSRVKRKPKKFDDVQLFGLKKRRNSQPDSQSDSANESEGALLNENNVNTVDTHKNTEKSNVINVDNNNISENQENVEQNCVDIKIVEVESTVHDTVLIESKITHVPANNALDEPVVEDKSHINDAQINPIKEVELDNSDKKDVETICEIDNNKIETAILTTPMMKNKEASKKSTAKKSNTKQSRIEKELAIDMVEGHPFLKMDSRKRQTRKKLSEPEGSNKRKPVTEKFNKLKTESMPAQVEHRLKEINELAPTSLESDVITVEEAQERGSSSVEGSVNEDPPCSEDVIESSQDSTLTTISVKSTKRTPKRQPVVANKNMVDIPKLQVMATQDLLKDMDCEMLPITNKSPTNEESAIELPQLKLAELAQNQIKLTDDMKSSQDLTLTKVSVKSTKRTPKRQPIVAVENLLDISKFKVTGIQHIPKELHCESSPATNDSCINQKRKDDVELPKTNTNELELNQSKLTNNTMESSQDSSLIINSVKSRKRTSKRKPIVSVEKLNDISKFKINVTQDSQSPDCEMSVTNKSVVSQESKDDIELPQNKTAELEPNQSELTENLDTEPIGDKNVSDDIISLIDLPIIISSEKNVGPETQELAEADTQPTNPVDFEEFQCTRSSPTKPDNANNPIEDTETVSNEPQVTNSSASLEDVNETASEPNLSLTACSSSETDVSSPFKDQAQRKQDFLNNTSEISPIKVQSPDKEKCSPTQETSSDYVVVKLSSPVQSNGEPFDKSGSPEFFTEDKISPDKRDQSPPRVQNSVNSGSPSSTLSLKKNRPQRRPGGRAAHMLGLCIPDSLNTIKNAEKFEAEEAEKGSTSTPVRRNLRVFYNAVNDISDDLSEAQEIDNFLKFKRALPSTDSSPSVPILKRKLVDIVDEATSSPANKRKRVSFHDPPVSTTVAVQKYIEPCGIRSPGSSHKRLERQIPRTITKSPKRLENAFVKLDTVLSKAVESFTEQQLVNLTNDTNNSLEVTPAIEIVKTSELNDSDPICPELVDCKDPIENIATELSSPAMRELFIKELGEKVSTIGDLAKMTELEVNRLCIKAPKVQVARKVLTDYVNKSAGADVNLTETLTLSDDLSLERNTDVEMTEPEPKTSCVETQTNVATVCDREMQTRTEKLEIAFTQTDTVCMAHSSVQTDESGRRTTSDIIDSCLAEREDFIDRLSERLDESAIQKISEKLPAETLLNITMNKCDNSIPKLVDKEKNYALSFIMNFLCDKFDNRDLMLFCSQLLQKAHDKPT